MNRNRGDYGEALPIFIYALSYIRQEHCRIVAFSRSLIIKGRMTSFKVVSVDILWESNSGFLDISVLSKISFFLLEATEPPLDRKVVSPTVFTIHALANSIFLHKIYVILTCKLASLI